MTSLPAMQILLLLPTPLERLFSGNLIPPHLEDPGTEVRRLHANGPSCCYRERENQSVSS